MAVCQAIGIEDGPLPRLASGFGGGIGGSGATCGALVGAVMTVGLVHGRDVAEGDRAAGPISRQVHDAFRDEMGSAVCRELIGFDLTTPEGASEFRGSEIRVNVCRKAVDLAARLALQQLQPDES